MKKNLEHACRNADVRHPNQSARLDEVECKSYIIRRSRPAAVFLDLLFARSSKGVRGETPVFSSFMTVSASKTMADSRDLGIIDNMQKNADDPTPDQWNRKRIFCNDNGITYLKPSDTFPSKPYNSTKFCEYYEQCTVQKIIPTLQQY